MNTTTPEQIILVQDNDGEILTAVRPIDPFNSGFTVDAIRESDPELIVTVLTVESLFNFQEHVS